MNPPPPRPGSAAQTSASSVRRDYGPKGCAELVLLPVGLLAILFLKRRNK